MKTKKFLSLIGLLTLKRGEILWGCVALSFIMITVLGLITCYSNLGEAPIGERQFKAVLTLEKTKYKVDEEIFITPRLINIGKQTVPIYHTDPLFFIEVYDVKGNRILIHPSVLLDILIIHNLKPGEQYFYATGYEFKSLSGYTFTIGSEGVYKVVSYAEFYLQDPRMIDEKSVKIYTNIIWIEVLR